MIAAPVAVLPLAALVGAVGWAGTELEWAPLAVAFTMIAVLALGSRALHLDGLSDVADALTSGHDAERSLVVMKDSAAGPAGAAALVLALGVQTAAVASLLVHERGPWVAATCVCVSRSALAIACARGVRAARSDGLAAHFAQTVPRLAALAVCTVVLAVSTGVFGWAGLDWWRGLVAAGVALGTVAVVVAHCVRRFGGVTGDVFGASIEISLAAALLVAS